MVWTIGRDILLVLVETGVFFLQDGGVFENWRVEIPLVTRRADFFKPEHNS